MKSAEFLAAVEYLGLTSWYMARELNVKELDVRYMMAGDQPVSENAEILIKRMVCDFNACIDQNLKAFESLPEDAQAKAVIPYYRGQREYLQVNGGEGYFKLGNALSREIAKGCHARGASVNFAYPDEQGFSTSLQLFKLCD